MSSLTADKSRMIKFLITFGVPVIFLLIPKGEVYTREMAIALAATFCLLAWAAFELTDLAVPSLLWPAVLILTGTVTYADVYSVWIGSDAVGVVAAMVLAVSLDNTGLLRRLAFAVSRKLGGSYTGAVYGVFLATFAVSFVTFNCGFAVVAAITYGTVKALKLEKRIEGAVIMMAGMLGGITMRMVIMYPFFINAMKRSINVVDPDFAFSQGLLVKYNWPVLFFCLGLIWLMIKLFVKKENVAHLNNKEYYEEEYRKLGKISTHEKIGIAVLLFIMISIGTYSIHGLDYMFSFIIGLAVMFLFAGGKAEDMQGCSLGMLFFFTSCMAIGSVCSVVGISDVVANTLTPILSAAGETMTFIITLVVGFLMNFCMTPMAMCAGFTGMIYDLAAGIGINPVAAAMTFYYSTDMVILPYEYIDFLIFFAFGAMTMKDFAKLHALKCVVFVVFFVAIILPYWSLVGLA
ncbi:MAG: anion permease [Peptococcaceae bacterium]|nr:anion permease [Peptococcaceae bacterium]